MTDEVFGEHMLELVHVETQEVHAEAEQKNQNQRNTTLESQTKHANYYYLCKLILNFYWDNRLRCNNIVLYFPLSFYENSHVRNLHII